MFILLFGLLFITNSIVLATAVDRMAFCDLEGYPGKTIIFKITLEGTDPEEKSGFWYTHYKKVEGDSDRMDITSWVTIEPKDYTIKEGETKVFTVKINIPKDAESGLWGAISKGADKEGHSGERRTYVVFKDALGDGNVYSGLLIPISVNVLPNQDSWAPIINFIKKNIVTIILVLVIIILLIPFLRKKKTKRRRRK